MRSEELRREIEAAFAWRPRRGDQGEATASDVEVRDRMGTLSHEGFVDQLPVFLTLALDADAYFEVGERLVFQLWSFPHELSALLTPAERRAVARVLQHLSEAYEKRGYRGSENSAFVALDHFWGSTYHDF